MLRNVVVVGVSAVTFPWHALAEEWRSLAKGGRYKIVGVCISSCLLCFFGLSVVLLYRMSLDLVRFTTKQL